VRSKISLRGGPYPADRAAIPVIQVLLADSNHEVRQEAMYWLEDLKELAQFALPDIIAALQDPDLEVQRTAVSILDELGPAAAGASQALRERFADPRPVERIVAAEAYHRVTGDAVLPTQVVIPFLQDESLSLRAAGAVEQFGPVAREAVPALIEIFKKYRARHRDYPTPVARALGRIGPAAREAIPSLRLALEDGDRNRCEVAVALWRIGERDEAIVNAVRTVLKEADGYHMREVLLDIVEDEHLAQLLSPDIRPLRHHTDEVVRSGAIHLHDVSRSTPADNRRKSLRSKMVQGLSRYQAWCVPH
jgi:HEAT repeat protein